MEKLPKPEKLGPYMMGGIIGKGGFGAVYKAINENDGTTVAIKKVKVGNMEVSKQGVIMGEIDLLKKLKHPNIVKYISCLSKDGFLYIVLEYIENGSLQSICKKFGQIPETLTSVYIAQVLEGLNFLHEQGVIHRDIKGANILTTKDGHVKLADFGVATTLVDNEKVDVVGTPYWMAPEIIDMSGPTTASDIWSVGSTVIELVSGNPPYFELDPLPAMFRIVQDDHPPLPEGVSGALRDFFIQCFQKDPNLRISAKKLLRHPWLATVKKNQVKRAPSSASQASVTSEDKWDTALTTIKNFNTSRSNVARSPSSANAANAAAAAEGRRKQSKVRRERSIGKMDAYISTAAATAADGDKQRGGEGKARPFSAIPSSRPSSKPSQEPATATSDNNQNWLGAARSMFDSAADMTAQVVAEKARLSKERPVSAISARQAAASAQASTPVPRGLQSIDLSGVNSPDASIGSVYSNSPTIIAGPDGSPLPRGIGGDNWDEDFEGDINVGSKTASTIKVLNVKQLPRALAASAAASTAKSATPPLNTAHVTTRKPSNDAKYDGDDWESDFKLPPGGALPIAKGRTSSGSAPAPTSTAAPAAAAAASKPSSGGSAAQSAAKARSVNNPAVKDLSAFVDKDEDDDEVVVVRTSIITPATSTNATPIFAAANNPAAAALPRALGGVSSVLAKYRDSDDSFNDFDVDDDVFSKIKNPSNSAPNQLRMISPETLQYQKDAAAAAGSGAPAPDPSGLSRYAEKESDADFSDLSGPRLKATATSAAASTSPSKTSPGKPFGHSRTGSTGGHPKLVGKISGSSPTSGSSTLIGSGGAIGSLKANAGNHSLKVRPPTMGSRPQSSSGQADDDDAGFDASGDTPLKLRSNNRMDTWNVAAEESEGDDDDPFADVEDEFEEYDEEEAIGRDKHARISTEILGLISGFRTPQPEATVLASCETLITLFLENPDQKLELIANHGVVPIFEMLEAARQITVVHSVLRVINTIVESNTLIQENLCLIGGLPAVMKYAANTYALEVRTEAVRFIREVCYSESPVTLQMFIASRGLPVLVECIEPDFAKFRPLSLMAFESILPVFEIETAVPKNDFARILTKCGFVRRMFTLLRNLLRDRSDPDSLLYANYIGDLFLLFSHADALVKAELAAVDLLKDLIALFSDMPPELLLKFIKTVKNLTYEPQTLSCLMEAGVIPKLIRILELRSGLFLTEMHNHVLGCLFNFCRISRERQEHAAVSGIVPQLKYFITIPNSPLRQVALQIICDIAYASKKARSILWENDGVRLFIDLLRDPYWQVNAVDALATWFQDDDHQHVEPLLSKPDAIEKIARAFTLCRSPAFDNMMEPLTKLTISKPAPSSNAVNRSLGLSKLPTTLIERLNHPKANVRLNLLKALFNLYNGSENKNKMVYDCGLVLVAKRLCNDTAILVQELARKLLESLEDAGLAARPETPV
ncbi:serine/threonine-protein kinase ppk11 [Capsaspora owczarzaki ATCC 30864]|uniref:non-specific serine/threonine protein kinase n=1 Tax=Capsaspora owczarzaki (strain ATCC 30864) TaxID=595528 RepID=A0A0D2X5K5_CAPO3|nr:serine/threonine-protein kinase ppk11 [Capsaspora owczarzaki ATCC 30864]KJE97969.1 STE/STE11/CDC15 protein kinase [Capsaspora owczarzaki ATCC 30864]|eukprot:XP_004342634.1 serine/threonine-protein kinase ppk11 [Capsaspora owczarzaki ATCC 30864]